MRAEQQKTAHAAYMREWKKNNKEKVNAINRAVRAKNPDLYRRINRESAQRVRSTPEGLERSRAAARRHRENHKEERQAATTRWAREKKPGYWLFKNAQYRAKKLGLPFTLTWEDIKIPEVCPVLGIPLVMQSGRGGFHPNSPSLDRIIPALGYVPSNVRVISNKANCIKRDASLAELEAIVAYVKRELG